MLSILIPTYNYNVLSLASELHRQCAQAQIAFEIIVIDDASKKFVEENRSINALPNCRYELLDANIGRSKIRNLLASKAKFEWLLFLDADTMPMHSDFISNYISDFDKQVLAINGGIRYTTEKPPDDKVLRWTYGREREALSARQRSENPYLAFLSLNFAISKSAFGAIKFDESLPNLRHEDTVFSYQLRENRISVKHIENPVMHLGLDTFEAMLKKEHEALWAFKQLLESEKIASDYLKMGRYYAFFKRWHLVRSASMFFRLSRKFLLSQISKPDPSLFLYDLYRLGYLCSL